MTMIPRLDGMFVGWSLGQRNGRPATWVDPAEIDPRDQTQGIYDPKAGWYVGNALSIP